MLLHSKLLSFDDVSLSPQYSEIESRANPDLTSRLSESVTLNHPVIATNMAAVFSVGMMYSLDQSGGIAIAHRFMNKEQLIELATDSPCKYFPFSIGIKDEDYILAQELFYALGDKAIVLIDIAHGHSKKMGEFVSKIKSIGFHTVIAGNVATPEGYLFLNECGADAVRVGIAGGKACTTKFITGHHIPTLQSVLDCADVKKNAKIIADGGISTSGDAVKAIAAGADFVCLGSVFAATSKSHAHLKTINDKTYKVYYGMSSQSAIDTFFPGRKSHVAPEGDTLEIPYTGETDDVLYRFLAGIKSALTYSGCKNLDEFRENAILLTKNL